MYLPKKKSELPVVEGDKEELGTRNVDVVLDTRVTVVVSGWLSGHCRHDRLLHELARRHGYGNHVARVTMSDDVLHNLF